MRVTSVPALYVSARSLPQLMPVGLLVTVPRYGAALHDRERKSLRHDRDEVGQ